MEHTLRCPKGYHINRSVTKDGWAKNTVIVALNSVAKSLRMIALFLMWDRSYLPSAACCNVIWPAPGSPLRDKAVSSRMNFRWIPETVKQCCGAASPKAKCNAGRVLTKEAGTLGEIREDTEVGEGAKTQGRFEKARLSAGGIGVVVAGASQSRRASRRSARASRRASRNSARASKSSAAAP